MDDFTIKPKLEKLNTKIEDTKSQLNEKFVEQEKIIMSAVTSIKADVYKQLVEHIDKYSSIKSDIDSTIRDVKDNITDKQIKFEDNLTSKYNVLESNLMNKYNALSSMIESNQKLQEDKIKSSDKNTQKTLDNFNKKINTLHFDIIDNHDNIAVTYVNPDGKLEYGAIKKVLPDDTTIKMNIDNKLYLNYNFDSNTLDVDSKNNINAHSLKLSDGKFLSASRIQNDLKNAAYNIENLTYKLEKVLKQLSNVNGYVASNNFKKSQPEQEALTAFALACLSTVNVELKASDLSPGTKIKNTYDNHIWILNTVRDSDGLSQNKWEDFGSDTICIASNDGVHGLVAGSQDKFKGYVDIKGTISINGLEEELNGIISSLVTLTTDINEYKLTTEAKLLDLENRLAVLER